MTNTLGPMLKSLLAAVLVAGGHAMQSAAQPSLLAATPPMGWNSWNHFGQDVDEATVRAAADALVESGMRDAGYRLVAIDDGWQGERDERGVIHPNGKFGDMRALGDALHAQGLKFGIYSSPGPQTCGGHEGSFGHEAQDAATYASWGVDYLKYDWCSATGDMKEAYRKMHDALLATGRPIVFSICQYGKEEVWRWGAAAGGNLWRTTNDIADNYARMSKIGFGQAGLARFAGPGHWNDPDMLEVGNGGMSADEYRTHMSLWALLAAPLLAGNDLTRMTPETLALLANPEVIAIDQDRAGLQGDRLSASGSLEIWVKPLADGSKAVGLFNRGDEAAAITVNFGDLGFAGSLHLRDLWARRDLGVMRAGYTADVPKHGAVLVLLSPARD